MPHMFKPVHSFSRRTSEQSTEHYAQLPRIDRDQAASYANACHLSEDGKRASRILATAFLKQSILTTAPLVAADFVAMWMLLFAVTTAVERFFAIPSDMVTRNTSLVASLLFVPIAHLKGLYPAMGTIPPVEFREIVQSAATALCIFVACELIVNSAQWQYLMMSTILTVFLGLPTFPAVRYLVRGVASKCSWWGSPVLIYGTADDAIELYESLQSLRPRGLKPAAVLLSSDEYWKYSEAFLRIGIPVHDVRTALECAVAEKATWLLVGTTPANETRLVDRHVEVHSDLNAIPNRVLLTTGGLDCGMWDRTHTIGRVSGLWLSNRRHSNWDDTLKRVLDLVVTLCLAVIFLPLIGAIMIAIRISSRGPIFYSQMRLGQGGKPFSAWKFRSMVPNADQVLHDVLNNDPLLRKEWNTKHKLKRDPRVTWIGHLIRTTSLNELPQLWNILRGDMSLVGPRPIVNSPAYDAAYITDYPSEYEIYCTLRPGLTGLWQVTCRNSGVYERRIYWDMYYVRNRCLWLDLYIILRTCRTMLLCEGAS